ncbi:MAG: hypothetical protein AAF607_04695 [Pseudomonadota bacterium]
MRYICVLLSVGLLWEASAAAQAPIEELQTSAPTRQVGTPDYGLFQSQAAGVTVTRGRSLDEERTFPSETKTPPKTTMSLKQNYRGSVFGKHRVAREGDIVYREQLLPIKQRDDE